MSKLLFEIDVKYIKKVTWSYCAYTFECYKIFSMYFIENSLFLHFNDDYEDDVLECIMYFDFSESEMIDLKLSNIVDERIFKTDASYFDYRLCYDNLSKLLEYIKNILENGRINDTIYTEEELYL